MNRHITLIIKNDKVCIYDGITNTTNVVIHDNIKKIHEKLNDYIFKQSISFNKVHKQDNSVNSTISNSKKTHKNIFKDVLKKIISVNKVYTCNNIFIYDECKKLHKELFNKLI